MDHGHPTLQQQMHQGTTSHLQGDIHHVQHKGDLALLQANESASRELAEANRQMMKTIYHPGHEHLHQMITIGLILMIIFSQIGLWYWKKNYERSFKRATLLGVWLIPFGMSVYLMFFRFVVIWLVFSFYTLHIYRKASKRPLDKNAPREIYRFFLRVYQVSSFLAACGYVLLVVEFIGLHIILPMINVVTYYGVLLIFYGLYFGLLDRDCAEVCADVMASTMGVRSSKKSGLPSKSLDKNTCSICLTQLRPIRAEEPTEEEEQIYTLPCGHASHEGCLRGWSIVGKKDTCSACNEKVRLGDLFNTTHPWLRTPVIWAQCLDALRYLLVWNPILLTCMQVFMFVLDR